MPTKRSKPPLTRSTRLTPLACVPTQRPPRDRFRRGTGIHVLERTPVRPHPVQSRRRADPEPAPPVHRDRLDIVAGQAVLAMGLVVPDLERAAVRVQALEAIGCRNPD